MIKFQKQKLFKDVISKAISAFAQNNGSILLAVVGGIHFIHAILEVINSLVFSIVNRPQLLVNTI